MKVMPLMFKEAAPGLLIVMAVVALTTLKVATSVLVFPVVAPGKVATPVLQFVCPAVGSQFPFVGAAIHDPFAADARSEVASRSDAASVAMEVARMPRRRPDLRTWRCMRRETAVRVVVVIRG